MQEEGRIGAIMEADRGTASGQGVSKCLGPPEFGSREGVPPLEEGRVTVCCLMHMGGHCIVGNSLVGKNLIGNSLIGNNRKKSIIRLLLCFAICSGP